MGSYIIFLGKLAQKPMQVCPQITFHGVKRSSWVQDYVAERLLKLDRYAEGITSSHVTLAREQSKHHKCNRYSAMVEARIPPHHALAVKHPKDTRPLPVALPPPINIASAHLSPHLTPPSTLPPPRPPPPPPPH